MKKNRMVFRKMMEIRIIIIIIITAIMRMYHDYY